MRNGQLQIDGRGDKGNYFLLKWADPIQTWLLGYYFDTFALAFESWQARTDGQDKARQGGLRYLKKSPRTNFSFQNHSSRRACCKPIEIVFVFLLTIFYSCVLAISR